MDKRTLVALFEKYIRKLRITPEWDPLFRCDQGDRDKPDECRRGNKEGPA